MTDSNKLDTPTIEQILNQIGYRGFVAGQQKDTDNADNLMKQSEISIERATQAINQLINDEVLRELVKLKKELYPLSRDDHYTYLLKYIEELKDGKN